MQRIHDFLLDEDGASAMEYAILVSFLALGVVAGATLLGNAIDTMFGNVNSPIQSAFAD